MLKTIKNKLNPEYCNEGSLPLLAVVGNATLVCLPI